MASKIFSQCVQEALTSGINGPVSKSKSFWLKTLQPLQTICKMFDRKKLVGLTCMVMCFLIIVGETLTHFSHADKNYPNLLFNFWQHFELIFYLSA